MQNAPKSPTLSASLLDDLKTHIAGADLSAHQAAILATARPAVALILDGPSQQILGETRFGGAPDLPLDMDWPRNAAGQALTFLAQINLSDIPIFENNPLPSSGWLAVFLGLDEPAIDVEHRLLLLPGDAELARATAPDIEEFANDENYLDMAPQRLKLQLRADIARWATSDFEELTRSLAPDPDDDGADEIEDALTALSRALKPASGVQLLGQLLGHASGIGSDPREDAFVVREVGAKFLYDTAHRKTLDMTRARNWFNLLRLDSVEVPNLNFCVWDAGYLNFLIHRDDLEKLDFARVYAAVESS